MRGHKHLIKCRCVLPQFKGRTDAVPHQFVVFSTLDDNDVPIKKYCQCNNCGVIHKVTDVCKSEIMSGKESMSSMVNISDIKPSLPQNLIDILERSGSDLPTWEHAQFVIENKRWGDVVVLAQEEESGIKQIKYVRIMSETFFKVENFNREEFLEPGE